MRGCHCICCNCSEHIDGAVRFILDEVCDKTAPLPWAIPSVEQFSEQIGKVKVKLSIARSRLCMHVLDYLFLIWVERVTTSYSAYNRIVLD